VGLIYLAPNGLSKKRALENTINFGISDAIYEVFPINYKAFAKSGPSADAFNEYWFSLEPVRRATRQLDMTDSEKFWADGCFFSEQPCALRISIFSAKDSADIHGLSRALSISRNSRIFPRN
jgi:hypothetical protein